MVYGHWCLNENNDDSTKAWLLAYCLPMNTQNLATELESLEMSFSFISYTDLLYLFGLNSNWKWMAQK